MSQISTLPPSSSYLSTASGSSNSIPPDSATNPAELLRQAALSSRKLKRDASVASLPRPLPRSIASTSSISLDYGQEEPSSPTSTPQQPPAPPPARAPTPTQTLAAPSSPPRAIQRDGSSGAAPRTPLDDDTSMREEGEISDNEDPPFRPPSKSIPAPITVTYADIKLEAYGSVHSPPFGVASRSPSVNAEDAYQHQRAAPLGSATSMVPASLKSPSPFRLETPLYVLDHDHVRPGLSLTQKQYDTAKEVILDILGYGVPPEYLIDCGISKEIIYYVFTELNLRLPSNLDTDGIPPYPPPPDVIASLLLSQSGHALSRSHSVGPNGNIARPGSVGRRNDSPLPPILHNTPPTAVPQVATTTSIDSSLSVSFLALSESTLTAIERQRKEELLARKAAQASRKRKESVPLSVAQVSSPSTTTTPSGADVSAKSSASAVSVDDFFNSIELPLSSATDAKCDPDTAKELGFVIQPSPEPMSVDETIPGFGRNIFSEYDQSWPSKDNASVPPLSEDTSRPRSASASERSLSVEREKELPTHQASQRLGNLPIRSRSDGILAPHLSRDNERDSRRSSTTPQPAAPIPRRGTKRPVAADFDSEPVGRAYASPGLSRTGSGTGISNGGAYHPNPHVRRKMNGVAGAFASLNSARRCVIDVSDSEDDTSEDEMPSATSAPRPQGALMQSSARDSALALELEIERMRKMIREREEMKLRKQVMASSRSTPVSRESPAVSRAFEGETSEMAASSSATRDEIPRSEARASENVLATTSTPSSPRLDVNCPSPISSTPSPPPLSSRDSKVSVHTALTDQSATPADGDQAIGGPALTAEPRQESAASSRASTPTHATGLVFHRQSPESGPEGTSVCVAASAQDSNGSQVMADSSFTAYNSVLFHYPLLSGRSLGPQEMADSPNLKGLRLQAVARHMTDNGLENARICQFEVPGGGECRDKACGDMHLSQLQMEPNDEETAQHMCGDQNVAQVVQALQAARTRQPEATFDERVKEVWASMQGLWIQATCDDKT